LTARPDAALLAALALLLLVLGLGSTALTDRDEGANAEAAREMWERGAWVTPTLNYAPRFAKPAFVYWLMSGAYATLGVGELAARLPSAIATALLVALQYAFARWALGREAGLRAALVLLLAAEVVVLGRLALTDAVLVLWTTAAGFAFFRAHQGPPPRRRWYAALWVAMALATLTKGPVGVLVPVAGIALYVTLAGGWRRLGRESGIAWGVPLFLAIAGPWYAAMFWEHGATYLARAEGETLGRVFRTVTGPGGTVLFYVPVLLLGFFPWSALLPAALASALRTPRARAAEGPAAAVAVFAAAWIVAVLAIFSLFQSRLPHYVAPLFPMAALLLAATWPTRVPPVSRGLLAGLGLVVAAGLAAGFALGDTVGRLLAPAYPAEAGARLPGSILLLAALGLGTAAAGALPDGRRLFAALAVLTTAFLAVGLHVVWPAFDARFVAPAGELVRRVRATVRPCDELVVLGPYRPSLVLYAGRRVTFLGRREHERLGALAARPGRLVVVAPVALAGASPALAGLPVLDRRGGYVALASAPVPGGCT
jgi:4-amino-4-deoxy-L-arabinose transferase-like glycosyltransferase